MNYKKESQFTNNASKRVFEEVYTNEDMTESRIYSDSYKLNVPQMFANNPSQEKAISPRRVECEPIPHKFTMRVSYAVNGEYVSSKEVFYSTGTHRTLENQLIDIFKNSTAKYEYTYVNEEEEEETQTITCSLKFDFDKITGDLRIFEDNEAAFKFEFGSYKDCLEFWRLLNQTGRPFNITATPEDFQYDSMPFTTELTLKNVWNREPLYVHASFSSSNKHYLCRTGDFWFKPSKYYYDNINSNDFDIFFTTDGTHRIIPYDAVKIIELCFILRQFARL